MAANAIPQLKEVPPEQFARFLSRGEIALGGVLCRLCPRDSLEPRWPDSLPDWSGCCQDTRNDTTTQHQADEEGIGLAKDFWLLGAGLTLLLDSLPKRNR